MTRPRHLLLLLPLAATVALAGCGDDDDGDSVDSAVASATATDTDSSGSLAGAWFLDMDSLELDEDLPADVEPITIAFTETDVAGNASCNNYTSTYTTTPEGGILFAGIVTTRKMCEPPVMAAEAAYLTQLGLVAGFEIDGDKLELSDAAGTGILEYTKDD